jgi:hypothetical protein
MYILPRYKQNTSTKRSLEIAGMQNVNYKEHTSTEPASSYCNSLVTLPREVLADSKLNLSKVRLATGCTVRGTNPGGGEIFRTRRYRPLGGGGTQPPI